jgi:hypothetical protein
MSILRRGCSNLGDGLHIISVCLTINASGEVAVEGASGRGPGARL